VKGLPSWVPDFSTWPDPKTGFQQADLTFESSCFELFMVDRQQNLYRAAGNSRTGSEVTTYNDVSFLQVESIFVDAITSISKQPITTAREKVRNLSKALIMWEPPSLDREVYVAGGSALEAYWRSLVKDTEQRYRRLDQGLAMPEWWRGGSSNGDSVPK
jgi:hypothetical protein